MKKHFLGLFVAGLALIAGGISYSCAAYYNGKIEARLDLLRGEYNIRSYGASGAWREKYREILLREYGVNLVEVAGCIVTDELVEEVRGYNEVSEAAIERRYGQGTLERVWHRARQEHDREWGSRLRE